MYICFSWFTYCILFWWRGFNCLISCCRVMSCVFATLLSSRRAALGRFECAELSSVYVLDVLKLNFAKLTACFILLLSCFYIRQSADFSNNVWKCQSNNTYLFDEGIILQHVVKLKKVSFTWYCPLHLNPFPKSVKSPDSVCWSTTPSIVTEVSIKSVTWLQSYQV